MFSRRSDGRFPAFFVRFNDQNDEVARSRPQDPSPEDDEDRQEQDRGRGRSRIRSPTPRTPSPPPTPENRRGRYQPSEEAADYQPRRCHHRESRQGDDDRYDGSEDGGDYEVVRISRENLRELFPSYTTSSEYRRQRRAMGTHPDRSGVEYGPNRMWYTDIDGRTHRNHSDSPREPRDADVQWNTGMRTYVINGITYSATSWRQSREYPPTGHSGRRYHPNAHYNVEGGTAHSTRLEGERGR